MNKYYKGEIIQRMFTEEEFAAFDQAYRKVRIPKPYSKWATDEERAEFLQWVESRKLNRKK